jgi:hypothetical protein
MGDTILVILGFIAASVVFACFIKNFHKTKDTHHHPTAPDRNKQ